MAIFAPPLRRTLQEFRDEPGDRAVRKNVRSSDWDGGTDLSSGPDTTATKGYFADYSAGAVQAEKLYIGEIDITSGDVKGDILPDADSTYDLGSSSLAWAEGHFDSLSISGAIHTPTTAAVLTSETTTSTSYTDLATSGPAVTVTTGTTVLVYIYSWIDNDTAGQFSLVSYAVSGDSTVAANDNWSLALRGTDDIAASAAFLETSLTPGSNTFTLKYKAGANTATFQRRRIIVVPF